MAGGEPPAYQDVQEILSRASITAAADSGMDVLRTWGGAADIWVGDMDSTRLETRLEDRPETRLETYPREKDETDTEIALRRLEEEGCRHITLLGGGGGRMDHLLSLYFLFVRGRSPALKEWILPDARVVRIDEHWELHAARGQTLSFFPLEDGCRMESRGLRWNLDGLEWSLGDGGISNRIDSSPCWVRMKQGSLAALIIAEKEGQI